MRNYNSEAHKLEKEIKSLGFQVDTHRYREIARYVCEKIQSVLLEVEKTHRVNLSSEQSYWEEAKQESQNFG
jgi:hypothetical protein